MARYPDSTPLAQLNIPGTHDSATWNYDAKAQARLAPVAALAGATVYPRQADRTQRRSMANALEAGVRFFDLRFAPDVTGVRLVFWHASGLLSETATLEDVLFGFFAWLDSHPTETVLLSLKIEDMTWGSQDPSSLVTQMQLYELLTGAAARRYILQASGVLGQLGAARGKAVVVRRFTLDKLPPEWDAALPGIHLPPSLWMKNSPAMELVYNRPLGLAAYIEDCYEAQAVPLTAGAQENIEEKVRVTTAHLDKAARAEHARALFITFASAERVYATKPVTPDMMALGGPGMPTGGVNDQLAAYLREAKGKRLGILVLDFWNEPEDLVALILGL
jgi:1-phosphatidylinositol phosphodiesterase